MAPPWYGPTSTNGLWCELLLAPALAAPALLLAALGLAFAFAAGGGVAGISGVGLCQL